MDIPPIALVFIAFGLFDIAVGLWAYLGNVEESGAPRGFRDIARSWHGRGSVCAAIPTGLFFMFLGLTTITNDDTLRRVFLYVAGMSLLTSVVFLLRPPERVWPGWVRAQARAQWSSMGTVTDGKADPEPNPERPQV